MIAVFGRRASEPVALHYRNSGKIDDRVILDPQKLAIVRNAADAAADFANRGTPDRTDNLLNSAGRVERANIGKREYPLARPYPKFLSCGIGRNRIDLQKRFQQVDQLVRPRKRFSP